jgi:hypothetical protein
MVKVFYLPAYFRMRSGGELRAQLLATALVFPVAWFLHAYQFFWLQGKFRITYNDSLFWVILGSLMVANTWIVAKYGKNRRGPARRSALRNALQVAATFALLSVLWSMWSANSLAEWVAFLRTGSI